MTEPDYPETVEALHLHIKATGESHVTLQRESTGFEETDAIEVVEKRTYVPVEPIKELIEEWEEVASRGDRDEMSRYEKGLKDDGVDKAIELREMIEE